jgi:hypothetical protein
MLIGRSNALIPLIFRTDANVSELLLFSVDGSIINAFEVNVIEIDSN